MGDSFYVSYQSGEDLNLFGLTRMRWTDMQIDPIASATLGDTPPPSRRCPSDRPLCPRSALGVSDTHLVYLRHTFDNGQPGNNGARISWLDGDMGRVDDDIQVGADPVFAMNVTRSSTAFLSLTGGHYRIERQTAPAQALLGWGHVHWNNRDGDFLFVHGLVVLLSEGSPLELDMGGSQPQLWLGGVGGESLCP